MLSIFGEFPHLVGEETSRRLGVRPNPVASVILSQEAKTFQDIRKHHLQKQHSLEQGHQSPLQGNHV
jgi:hypothetical protein